MSLETIETIESRRLARVARFPNLVPVGRVARQVIRGGMTWGVALGLMTWAIVNEYAKEYPTAAARARLAETHGADAGSRAIFGPAHQLDTVAGYAAFHIVAFFVIIGAVWGLLAGTRLLRGEEDAGRWELLLAGPTTRRRAAAGAMAGLGIGLFTFWAVSSAAVALIGRTADPPILVSASLFTAVAAVASAAMFLAVGALCSQLAATRRQAAALAAAVLGVLFLIRAVANSNTSLEWLHWASPLGWVDELRPLTASRPWPLVPITALTAALVAATILLAGRRDLGAGVLPARHTAPSRTRFLNGPLGLAHRLNLRTGLGWITGVAAGGLVLALSTKSVQDSWEDSSSEVMQRLGGGTGGDTYLGILFLVVALLLAMAAAGQVGATREEEAEGYLDHLLARPVARLSWLAGRFAVSTTVLVAAGVVAGLFTWIGAASSGADVSLPSLLAAGINVVPVGILVLGIGTMFLGLAPRLAGLATYGIVVWSFLAEIIGASLGASRWLLDTSVLHHIARAPAADVRWDSAAILVAVGVAAAVIGALAFNRRDLKGA